jgi:hypothetical protein
MSVGTDYATPVLVNGFSCIYCTDVGYAKKHIDPAHPRSGPYGIDAKDDPTAKQTASVTFGGALSALNDGQDYTDPQDTASPGSRTPASEAAAGPAPGAQLDISA